ncbi:MAG: Holliday junction branch migration protein RuvA [Actinobacteria bacterium QS_5_72_10]|nr:MAG: Holliday junction branch migration protein RuvA [Actinobacteria bacterium QS_5_72_10]
MIAQLRGTVVEASLDRMVVDVAGVGYEVRTPPSVRARPGEDIAVYTHLVVSDDALTLYGFASVDERDVFLALTGVSRVGPKLALAALGTLGAQRLREAVHGEDVTALTAVPGIGRKGAQRLILELRETLVAAEDDGSPTPSGDGAGGHVHAEVRQALAGLGYAADETQAALAAVPDDDDPEALLRAALQRLGGR